MTIHVLLICCYKTVAFFVNCSILPSSCCYCKNICYGMILCVTSCSFEAHQETVHG